MNNYFTFNKKFFQQTERLTMGNPLSPTLADIYMSYLETHIVNAFPQIYKFWRRYVDDVFAIIPQKLKEDSLKLLNLQDQHIQFTIEVEEDNSLPFLDLKITRKQNGVEFGIYRKPTHIDNYIKKNECNPVSHQLAVFRSLVHRLYNVPLNKEEFLKEQQHIQKIAELNGFNPAIVNNMIKRKDKLKTISQISTLTPLKDNNWTYRKFTYHPWAFKKFERIFKKLNIKLAPQNKFSLKNLLNKPLNNTIPNISKSGIYQIDCENCEKSYIGKTKRNLEIRQKEHLRNIKLKQTEKSAVSHHFWTENHNIGRNIKLLKPLNSPIELDIWEKIYIIKNSNKIVNFEIPAYNEVLKHCAPNTRWQQCLDDESRKKEV